MIKACIFNLEGVIVDTQRIFYEALDDLALKWGIDPVEHPAENEVTYGEARKITLEALIQRSGKIIDASQRSDIMEAIDAEIAAHIGEVLWSIGQREEALKIWREARKIYPDNEVLIDVMKKFVP